MPIASIKQQKLNHTFTLSRDVTLTDAQLRDRIRERFLESSIMVAVRDVIGYVLFMVIITLVFAERSVSFVARWRSTACADRATSRRT